MGGEGPIPLSEIEAYCRLFGIADWDERAVFTRIIRDLDRAYLEYRREQAEKERESRK